MKVLLDFLVNLWCQFLARVTSLEMHLYGYLHLFACAHYAPSDCIVCVTLTHLCEVVSSNLSVILKTGCVQIAESHGKSTTTFLTHVSVLYIHYHCLLSDCLAWVNYVVIKCSQIAIT